MIKSTAKKGTRVIVIGNSKTKGRIGTVLSAVAGGMAYYGQASIRLDATSDKPACNITILRKNVEKV